MGIEDAWLVLYRLHAEPRSSVANLPMARVFLEKSANRGCHEAQRVLGALLMSECTDLSKAERAIAWLHQAALAGARMQREQDRDGALPPTLLRWKKLDAKQQPPHDKGQRLAA